MSDSEASGEDRHLPASPRRLQQAREQGRLPRSRDLGHALVLGAALAVACAWGASAAGDTAALLREGLAFGREAAFDPAVAGERLGRLAGEALWILLPPAVACALAGGVASAALGGVVASTTPVTPDLSRISLLAGLGRLFSRDGAIDLVKLVLVAAVLVAVAATWIVGNVGELAALARLPVAAASTGTFALLGSGAAVLLAVVAATAVVDAPLQLWRWHAGMRMTHAEAKQEHRESEGDPQLKARIRQRQREAARRRMMAAVPTADVVVTNPTHYAVALRYAEGGASAPRVVAKGADAVAAKIRELADEHRVPRLESPALARALHRHCEIGDEIPAALYAAVAQVLAWVYRLRRHRPGVDAWPDDPVVEVPQGLDPAAAARTDRGGGGR